MTGPSEPGGTAPVPGEVVCGTEPVVLFAGRTLARLVVVNTGDRPVQVGSHFHFAETNAALDFDRKAAWGHRLAILAGTSVRFEPGIEREVDLVPLAGARIVPGLRGLAAGSVDPGPADPTSTSTSTSTDSTSEEA